MKDFSIIESVINKCWSQSCELFTSLTIFPYKRAKDIYNFFPLDDLLLDIFCDEKAFYTTSLNNIFGTFDALFDCTGLTFSKRTLYNNFRYLNNDLMVCKNDEKTYADSFLYNMILDKENGANLNIYNNSLTGTIISHWKYMPFNPRFLNSSPCFGNITIPPKQYQFFLSLNNCLEEITDIDRLIYNHLTDHFFNINLFCQFIYYLHYVAGTKDYAFKLESYVNCYILFFNVLQSLPTWKLKQYFWEIYVRDVKEKGLKEYVKIIEEISKDACYFSLVSYPIIKILFNEYLTSELCISSISKEDLFSYIKTFLKRKSGLQNKLYPDFTTKFQSEIEFFDTKTLNALSRIFYSLGMFTPFSDHIKNNNYSDIQQINYYFEEIDRNINKIMYEK